MVLESRRVRRLARPTLDQLCSRVDRIQLMLGSSATQKLFAPPRYTSPTKRGRIREACQFPGDAFTMHSYLAGLGEEVLKFRTRMLGHLARGRKIRRRSGVWQSGHRPICSLRTQKRLCSRKSHLPDTGPSKLADQRIRDHDPKREPHRSDAVADASDRLFG